MSRRAKIAALLAFLGMACISLCGTVLLARPCCSTDCEKCPVSISKVLSADLATKIVSPEIAVSGLVLAVSLSIRPVARFAGRIFELPGSGFLRPMRN